MFITADDELLNTKQVAELLNRPADTLRWWRYVGEGPKYFKMSARTILYKKKDVLDWVNEKYAEMNPDTEQN